jgi:hypothetical protein
MAPRVTIALFAHVQAAVDDAWPLADVLGREGIPQATWDRAELTLRTQVARDVTARVEYEEALVAAQDRFARSVAPVDAEPAAWLALLDAMAAAPAPFSFLTRRGLRMSDVARLRRSWARRIEEDAELERQITELRSKRLPPLPALRVGDAPYAPFGVPEAPKASAGAPPSTCAPAEIDGVGLDRLAALDAELQRAPRDEAAVLARFGLDHAQHHAIAARFEAAFARDPSLERDYRQLLAHHARRLQPLSGSGAEVARERGEPPATAARAAPVLDSGSADAELARQLGARLAAQGLTLRGTALAPEQAGHGAVMPFGAPSTPALVAAPTDVEPARRERLHDGAVDLDTTGEMAVLPADGPVLPFPPTRGTVLREAPPARLTLEQFASLSAELSLGRAPRAELFARYLMDERQWPIVSAGWRESLEADPTSRARFDVLVRQFVEFLAHRAR